MSARRACSSAAAAAAAPAERVLFRYKSDFRWPLRLASALASAQLGVLAVSWWNIAQISPPEAVADAAEGGEALSEAAVAAAAGVVMPSMYFNVVAGSTIIASAAVVAAVPLFASRLLCKMSVSLVPRGRSHTVPVARIATHSMLNFGATRTVPSLGIRVLDTGHARYTAVELLDDGATQPKRYMLDKMVGTFEDSEGNAIADADAAIAALREALNTTRVDAVNAARPAAPRAAAGGGGGGALPAKGAGWTPPEAGEGKGKPSGKKRRRRNKRR